MSTLHFLGAMNESRETVKHGTAIRRCAVCGARRHKGALYRYTWMSGQPQLDSIPAQQGRGVYVCRENDCQQQFLRRSGKWRQLFRCTIAEGGAGGVVPGSIDE